MTTDVFQQVRGPVDPRSDKAIRAVATFRKMQPTLSAFARALTKKPDIKVEMDKGSPRTNGKVIYFRPPIVLGEAHVHQRGLCEKRGDDLLLMCKACAARESVLVTIYHEIAHICYDTFAVPSDEQRKELVAHAVREAGGKRAESIASRIERAPYYMKGGYMGLATLVSEYLPTIVNALEDARVNREMFKARPGTKIMFEGWAADAFSNGVEQQDGSIILWREYPADAQAMVGLFCLAAGYDFDKWFHPQVVEALHDEKLRHLVNRMDTIRSVSGVYELSYPVLDRLRDLGFCINPEDEPEPEPEPEPSDETTEEPQDEPGEPTPDDAADSDDDESGDDPVPDAEDDESGDGPEAGDEGDSDSDDAGEPGPGEPDSDDESGDGGDSDGGEPGREPGTPDGEPSDDDAEAGEQPGSGDEGAGVRDDDPDGSGNDDLEPENTGTGDIGDDPEAGRGEGGAGEEAGGDSDDDAGSSGTSDVQSGDDEAGSDSDGSAAGGAEDAHDGDPGEGAEGEAAPADGTDDSAGADGGGDTDSEVPEPDSDADDAADRRAGEAGEGDPGEVDPDAHGTGESGDTAAVASPSGTPDGDGEDGTLDGGPADGAPEEPVHRPADMLDEVDTGADKGEGGTELIVPEEEEPLPEPGTAADAKRALRVFGDHDDKPLSLEAELDNEAVDVAIVQGMYFEQPSANVSGVNVHHFGDDSIGWTHEHLHRFGNVDLEALGVHVDTQVPESILGPALLKMRVVFSENKRSDFQRNLKSGRINSRTLGNRAWGDDGRLFKKKRIPGKRDYFVVLGIDISGSTLGTNLALAKRAAYAQAELCARMGVQFAVYAHTAVSDRSAGKMSLEIYEIKGPHDPWSTSQQTALNEIASVSDNLDGHSIEYYRKRLDESQATDRIIMYYTDGKMPAANHDEELQILRREISTCKQKGYTLMGVGIRTDSPIRHGLDTVQVDDDDDLVKVVKHLEKKLV